MHWLVYSKLRRKQADHRISELIFKWRMEETSSPCIYSANNQHDEYHLKDKQRSMEMKRNSLDNPNNFQQKWKRRPIGRKGPFQQIPRTKINRHKEKTQTSLSAFHHLRTVPLCQKTGSTWLFSVSSMMSSTSPLQFQLYPLSNYSKITKLLFSSKGVRTDSRIGKLFSVPCILILLISFAFLPVIICFIITFKTINISNNMTFEFLYLH